MRLKDLEMALAEIDGFGDQAKIGLEQYSTPAHIASRMIHVARQNGDIEGKYVCDLGAGTGALSIGAILGGAVTVFSVEIDKEALETLAVNADNFEVQEQIEPVVADIFQTEWLVSSTLIDTIIMNPPFGTRNRGADIAFLETALTLANTVYSLHKTSTRKHVILAAEKLGAKAYPLATIKYPLPKSYSFHTRQNQDIAVDFFKFTKPIL